MEFLKFFHNSTKLSNLFSILISPNSDFQEHSKSSDKATEVDNGKIKEDFPKWGGGMLWEIDTIGSIQLIVYSLLALPKK